MRGLLDFTRRREGGGYVPLGNRQKKKKNEKPKLQQVKQTKPLMYVAQKTKKKSRCNMTYRVRTVVPT